MFQPTLVPFTSKSDSCTSHGEVSLSICCQQDSVFPAHMRKNPLQLFSNSYPLIVIFSAVHFLTWLNEIFGQQRCSHMQVTFYLSYSCCPFIITRRSSLLISLFRWKQALHFVKQVLRLLTSNQWRKHCVSIISCFNWFLHRITDWGFVAEESYLKSSLLKLKADRMVVKLSKQLYMCMSNVYRAA